MPTFNTLQLRCRHTGRWLIWNHQTYLFAHDPREVVMGCLMQANTPEDAQRVIDEARKRPTIGLADIEIVPVQVHTSVWCKPLVPWLTTR